MSYSDWSSVVALSVVITKFLYWMYTLPQKKLFWSCLSFRDECRSVTFGPNVISAVLLITICQNPHCKIRHRSRTVIKHLSASHGWNFTKLDASKQFPSRHGPDFHRPQSQITIDGPDFHLRRSQNCLLGWKLPFFFGRVYVRKSGFTSHYLEPSWQQYAKDPIPLVDMTWGHLEKGELKRWYGETVFSL